MPIPLDPSLPPSLYPLAWLMGPWSGSGAVTLHEADGSSTGRRIEQTLQCTPDGARSMRWRMRTELLDAPAPLPPTSVFVDAEAPRSTAGTGERDLLMRESGTWSVGDPLPGQDLEAARRAKPGDPAGVVSYALTARLDSGDGEVEWAGEVRGPRIRLAQRPGQDATAGVAYAERMFGYVGGRLMWLWERAAPGAAAAPGTGHRELSPFLSVEMDRAEEAGR